MDRSRISSAVPEAVFAARAVECGEADVVVVDLRRHAESIAEVRQAVPAARIVAFGPHVDDEVMAQAGRAGADLVLPRSRFFRDVAAALGV